MAIHSSILAWRIPGGAWWALRSSSCLGRKPPLAPQLEETPETPPSSRAEGLLFLHGLESNPGYAGQEATVRTGYGTADWFQIGKGVRQGYILSPCLFNFYGEYIMRNAGLEEAQAGIKIAGRNINNLISGLHSRLPRGVRPRVEGQISPSESSAICEP